MQKIIMLLALLAVASSFMANAEPDWSRGVSIPPDGRPNPYMLAPAPLATYVRAGKLHALNYPVEVSGLLIPYRPIDSILKADSQNPLRFLLQKTVDGFSGFHNFDDVERWLGMQEYPAIEGDGDFQIPFLNGQRPEHRMGFTLLETQRGKAFTISCAECHSGNLFGRKILGLSNRFPRANDFFSRALQATPVVSPSLFQWATGATSSETQMYKDARFATDFIAARKPVQLGLDTSLAQVALSLAKRAPDAWATRIAGRQARPDPIENIVADSKPAVWWNVKYKNRWLADGSVVSGNPVYTNFLWNEIGRGTDLHALDDWFSRNDSTIAELTSAVFASQAPRFTDFFAAASIDETQARQGEQVFLQHCAQCHGTYEKAWSGGDANRLSWEQRLATVRVNYPTLTPVVDVGTDLGRARGMNSLAQLNHLAISTRQNIVIEPQLGYVPPPLVGIWARWPYFHNNSAPSLCAVLTRASARPVQYWAREASDPNRDFDAICNGYPGGPPAAENLDELLYDTRQPGRSNVGHDEGVFLENGRELLNVNEKAALIAFLKTL